MVLGILGTWYLVLGTWCGDKGAKEGQGGPTQFRSSWYTWYSVLGTWYLVLGILGTWYLVYLVLGFWYSILGAEIKGGKRKARGPTQFRSFWYT